MHTSRISSGSQIATFQLSLTQRAAEKQDNNTRVERPFERDGFSSVGTQAQLRSLLSGSVKGQEAQSVQDLFKEQFTDKAQNAKEFHAFMKQVFGDDYDRVKAESFRQKALAGDFSWLPKVQYVADGDLGGAHGAYDSASGTVFLNASLKGNPELAARTFVEEAGHHLDAQLNVRDTAGDEGEMFRRLLAGESLSAAQVKAIQTENDKGVITVDGREIEVEFWNPWKAVKKAAKSVGNAIKKGAKAVGEAVGSAVTGVAKGVGSVLKGVGDGVSNFFSGIGQGLGGFVGNLFQGNFGDAVEALATGASKALLVAPTRVFNGLLNGVEDAAHGALHLLGPWHHPARVVFDRIFDAGRSLTTGAWDLATSVAHNALDACVKTLKGIGNIVTGNFAEGFKNLGGAVWDLTLQNVADAALLGLGRAVSSIQTLLGLEAPGRRLTSEEIAILEKVYGDSIDYDAIRIKEGDAGLFSTNDRPFCHGNTIYMKDRPITPELLVHEVAHVWQHQNGGADYMMEALVSMQWGHGYDWEKSVPGTAWEDLEPEQQAELLETAYAENYFTTGVFRNAELTAYMDEVMRRVRNGEGAP